MRTAASALAKLEVGGCAVSAACLLQHWGTLPLLQHWGPLPLLQVPGRHRLLLPYPLPDLASLGGEPPAGGSRNNVLEGLHDGSASPSSTSSASSLRDGFTGM